MTIDEAIEVLCRVHTRDDPEAGFTVQMVARPDPWDHYHYVPAWEALIKHRNEARRRWKEKRRRTTREEAYKMGQEAAARAKISHDDEYKPRWPAGSDLCATYAQGYLGIPIRPLSSSSPASPHPRP